ncbi:hypothetical protein LCGC14_1313120 [marine sediment metagenome]|uniref:Uncharacterized protein n=1 Tax=marine sediment metagenome TaxID=412755 RepID=A0A0F9KLL6_9ZZZZ
MGIKIDVCRGCGRDVFEPNLQIARFILSARRRQGFRVIHGWWIPAGWTDRTK